MHSLGPIQLKALQRGTSRRPPVGGEIRHCQKYVSYNLLNLPGYLGVLSDYVQVILRKHLRTSEIRVYPCDCLKDNNPCCPHVTPIEGWFTSQLLR